MLKSLIAALDLTGRKRAENELRKNEVRLEEAQRIAHFGWWERDFSTNRVFLSDELCRIFGVQPADVPEWHQRWLKLNSPGGPVEGSRGSCNGSTQGAALRRGIPGGPPRRRRARCP